jgi:DNA segregation ATPase FtsK/SpoIIIE, S-DNA-T family
VLPPADPVRLALPASTAPPARHGIPIIATLAPVAMSLAVWAVTQSLLSLLFAGLGPLVALAGLVDARRQARRRRREETVRLGTALERLRSRTAEAGEAERVRLAGLCAPDGESLGRWAAERWSRPLGAGDPIPVRIGRGAAASPVRLDGDDADAELLGPQPAPALTAAWTALREETAALDDAPLVVDAVDGIGIAGPLPLAAAVARALALQAAAVLPPDGEVAAPASERWASALPHATVVGEDRRIVLRATERSVLVAWTRDERELPPGCGTIIRLDAGGRAPALALAEARVRAAALAEVAARLGIGSAVRALPERVALEELLAASTDAHSVGLAAPIGRDADGPVVVDLVADGPHALVGGTTGSGKSELLVSWVLAMAHGRRPDEVGFLLVDFKGGAAFAPLAGLPHVVGILSDLDARLTRRAIESLRAELLRRERLLADAGARSIAELPPGALARLVVVVDEFAAVVAGQPELHDVFGDLAARGRSLGLHLVLCTQRPAGVVRDGVLANVTLRIGLRMTDRADSIALLGDDGASRLPADARGRSVLGGDGTTRPFQVAIADPAATAAAIANAELGPGAGAGAGAHAGAAFRPWLDPLPTLLPRSAIGAASAEAVPFGLVDLPAEQRQPVAVHRPAAHGHLLILGAGGSGRTAALALFTAAPGAIVLPEDPADVWQLLELLLRETPRAPRLLLADDLDLVLGRTGPDERHELLELLARLLREGASRSLGVVASAQRLAGSLSPLAGLFGSRLLLRMPSREEHVLAGGAGADFDPAAPPGSGRWRGAVVQVAWAGEAEAVLPAPARVPLPFVAPEPGRPLAIVAARPAGLAPGLRAAGYRLTEVGAETATTADPADAAPHVVLLGDPDAWQADWTLLARARRELRIAVVGCSAAELRALVRPREAAPPLGSGPGECWLVEDGTVRRARLAGAA